MKLSSNQTGQTLIETLVAAFILVMGISAALGLANYSLGATSNIRQQTVAIGLAREGLEVVKNMRDTNWLKTTMYTDCYDFLSGNNTASCYREWLNGVYNIDPEKSLTYVIGFNPQNELPWSLEKTSDFALNIDTDIEKNGIFYYPSMSSTGTSKFYRKITISKESFEPFDRDTGGRLTVTSQVWWVDRNCPAYNDVVEDNPCLVTLQTYLTNWKNF